jgi:signal transduction histidine kinase
MSVSDPPPHVAHEHFRICQEAMTNAVRHAGATRIVVGLRCRRGQLVLRVSDNGKEITGDSVNSPRSHGVRGMFERAALLRATVKIAGRKGKGTLVVVRVRLAGMADDSYSDS